MNKTQKRCFAASMILHGSLLAALFIGSAFTKSRPKEPPIILHAVDPRIVEGILSRDAGNPNVTELRAPAPAPEPVQPLPPAPQPEPKVEQPKVEPQPEPPKVEPRQPEPVREKPVVTTPEPVPVKPPVKKQPVKPRIQVDTTKTVRRPVTTTSNAEKQRQEQAAADARARAAAANKVTAALRNSITAINSGAAPSDRIEVPGLGGEAFANYSSAVYTAFYRAWITSGVEAPDSAITRVEVKVAKNGDIISKRIVKRSGVPALDKSVQQALDRVNSLPAFPDGAKDAQRSFIINFTLSQLSTSG